MTTIQRLEAIEATGNTFVNDPSDNSPIRIASLPVAEVTRIYNLIFPGRVMVAKLIKDKRAAGHMVRSFRMHDDRPLAGDWKYLASSFVYNRVAG